MPGTSLDTSQLRSEMDTALLEALPPDMVEQGGVKKLSTDLEKTIANMLSQMIGANAMDTTVTRKVTMQDIDQFGNPPSTSAGNPADEASQAETEIENPEADTTDEVPENENVEEQEQEKETEQDQEEPTEKSQTDQPEPAVDNEEVPENTGFQTPADERADMTQPAIPDDTKDTEKTDDNPTKTPQQHDQQMARAMTQARNKERHQQAQQANTTQNQQQTNQKKEESDMVSNATYPIILMVCFFRDIVAITQLIPIINFVSIQVMAPLFVGVFFVIALLDTKFFVFLLQELFGIQFKQESAVKKGAEAAAKKIGMAVWEILLIVLVFIVWPYTFFFMYYRGKYIREKKQKNTQHNTGITANTQTKQKPPIGIPQKTS